MSPVQLWYSNVLVFHRQRSFGKLSPFCQESKHLCFLTSPSFSASLSRKSFEEIHVQRSYEMKENIIWKKEWKNIYILHIYIYASCFLPSCWSPQDTSGIKSLFDSSHLAICSCLSFVFLLVLNTIQLLCRIYLITPPDLFGPLKLWPFTKVYL